MPISHRIGFATVVESTRSSTTGHLRFAMPPANPVPTGTRTPCRTSSSKPHAARATSSSEPPLRSSTAAVSASSTERMRAQQFGKEIVNIETGQRRVGDGEHLAQLFRRVRRRHGASLSPSHQPQQHTAVSMRVILINTW